MALKKPYISYEKFEEICSEIAIQENYNFGEGMQDILAKLLNDLGILLSFKETKNQLDSLQVFQPEWIVNGIYGLVVQSNNQIDKNKGILTEAQVTEILRAKGYKNSTEQNFIKGMLKEFRLAYSHTFCGETNYFIPSVFDDNRPFEKLEFWDKPAENQKFLRFRYTYANWRTDLINYVIVEENTAIKDDIFWKNGVVLEYDYDGKSNQIFVEADNTHEHIDLIICGTADLRLTLEKFRKTLMPSIHKIFTNLGEKEWIIYEENGVKVPIDYKNLLVYLEEKEDKIFIPELRKKLNVKDLLGYVDLPPEPAEIKYARLVKEGKQEEAELLRQEYAKEMSFGRFKFMETIEEIDTSNIFDYIDRHEIFEAFELIEKYELQSPILAQLKSEFTQNKQSINFHSQLKMAVQEAIKRK